MKLAGWQPKLRVFRLKAAFFEDRVTQRVIPDFRGLPPNIVLKGARNGKAVNIALRESQGAEAASNAIFRYYGHFGRGHEHI